MPEGSLRTTSSGFRSLFGSNAPHPDSLIPIGRRKVYEPGTQEYENDLKSRNGGLIPGRDDDQIKFYYDQITSGGLTDKEAEILAGRNPNSASAFLNALQNRRMREGLGSFRKTLPSGEQVFDPVSAQQHALQSGQFGMAADIAGFIPQEKERRIVEGPDGRQYYVDNQEPVLPDVKTQPKDRKIIQDAQGRSRYTDTGEFVFPNETIGTKLTSLEENLQTAGYVKGTPEWQEAARQYLFKPQVQIQQAPSGYQYAGDGKSLTPIPGGPADTRTKPLTEGQAASALYADRAYLADDVLNKLEGKYSPYAINAKQAAENMWIIGGTVAGPLANKALSQEDQQAEQAQRDFVNAILRRESGAVINQEEFDNARKQYFPQPNDSEAVKKQKSRNRRTAIEGLKRASGGAYEYPKITTPNEYGLVPGQEEDGYIYQGGNPADQKSWKKK